MDFEILGIYCIENKVNGKRYIGQGQIVRRYKEHNSHLKNNEHKNNNLQTDWNQYGEENFIFYALEICEDEELNNREVYYINLYDTYDLNYGYNLTKGGLGLNGYKPSIETIEKRVLSRKQKRVKRIMPNEERRKHMIKRKDSSSKYFGVLKDNFIKTNKIWKCYVRVNGKVISLGYHKDEKEAAKTYNKYIIENNLDHPLNDVS